MRNRSSRESRPAEDIQVRGNNGVFYQIPAASLLEFAVAENRAWKVPGSVGFKDATPILKDSIRFYAGPKNSIVNVSPLKLIRLVKFVVDNRIDAQFSKLVKKYDYHSATLPSSFLRDLSRLARSNRRSLQTRWRSALVQSAKDGCSFVQAELPTLVDAMRSLIEGGLYSQVTKIVQSVEKRMLVSLPTPLVNEVKTLIADKLSKDGVSTGRTFAMWVVAAQTGPTSPPPDAGIRTGGSCEATQDTGMMGCAR